MLIMVLFSCKKEPVSEHFIDGSWYVSTYLPSAMVPDTGLYKLQKFDGDDITMNVNQKLNLVTIHNQKSETFPLSTGVYEYYIDISPNVECSKEHLYLDSSDIGGLLYSPAQNQNLSISFGCLDGYSISLVRK